MRVQTLEGHYKQMALLRQWIDKLKQQSTVNNQNTEDDLKILLRILSITLQTLLPSYIYMIRQYMSGRHLTQSEYALQRIVELFGDLLIQLEEAHLTHTY
jgi:hypothetical protein